MSDELIERRTLRGKLASDSHYDLPPVPAEIEPDTPAPARPEPPLYDAEAPRRTDTGLPPVALEPPPEAEELLDQQQEMPTQAGVPPVADDDLPWEVFELPFEALPTEPPVRPIVPPEIVQEAVEPIELPTPPIEPQPVEQTPVWQDELPAGPVAPPEIVQEAVEPIELPTPPIEPQPVEQTPVWQDELPAEPVVQPEPEPEQPEPVVQIAPPAEPEPELPEQARQVEPADPGSLARLPKIRIEDESSPPTVVEPPTPPYERPPVTPQEPPVTEQPPVIETPIVPRKPVISEEPPDAEQPPVIETPIVPRKPVGSEEPPTAEQPPVIETPIVPRSPVASETPSITRPPVDSHSRPMPELIPTPHESAVPESHLTPEGIRPVGAEIDAELDDEDVIDVEWVIEVGEEMAQSVPVVEAPYEEPTGLVDRTGEWLKVHGIGIRPEIFLAAVGLVMVIGLIGGALAVVALARGRLQAGTETPTAVFVPPTDVPPTLIATPIPGESRGRIAYASDADGDFDIYILDLGTRAITFVTRNDISDRSPDWSPDGTRIVYVSDQGDGDDLWVINADGSNPSQLTTDAGADRFPDWSPDGASIIFTRETADGASLMLLDATCLDRPETCEANVRPVVADGYNLHPHWHPDQVSITFTLLEFPGLPSVIASVHPDGSSLAPFAGTGGSDFSPAWSPDGQRVAFVSNAFGDFDIIVMLPSGLGANQVTGEGGDDVEPTWSPDGQYILFASDRAGGSGFDLYILPVSCLEIEDGCIDAARRISDGAADELNPSWTNN